MSYCFSPIPPDFSEESDVATNSCPASYRISAKNTYHHDFATKAKKKNFSRQRSYHTEFYEHHDNKNINFQQHFGGFYREEKYKNVTSRSIGKLERK